MVVTVWPIYSDEAKITYRKEKKPYLLHVYVLKLFGRAFK